MGQLGRSRARRCASSPPRRCCARRALARGAAARSCACTPCARIARPPPLRIVRKEGEAVALEQIKAAFVEHGPTFVATYATLYTAGLGVAYTGVCLSGLDAQEWIRWSGVEAAAGIDLSAFARLINGVIALEMNELAEFVRLPTVLLLTPKVTRLIRGPAAAAAKPATAAKPVLTTRAGPGARDEG